MGWAGEISSVFGAELGCVPFATKKFEEENTCKAHCAGKFGLLPLGGIFGPFRNPSLQGFVIFQSGCLV